MELGYSRITKIFKNINNAPASEKEDLIKSNRMEVKQIEGRIYQGKEQMDKMSAEMKTVLRETCDVDKLHATILERFKNYFEHKIERRKKDQRKRERQLKATRDQTP